MPTALYDRLSRTYCTTKEAAQIIGSDRNTVGRMVLKGYLRGIRLTAKQLGLYGWSGGRVVLVLRSDVQKFLDRRARRERAKAENTCLYGHPKTPDNVYVHVGGSIQCLECRKRHWRLARRFSVAGSGRVATGGGDLTLPAAVTSGMWRA